MHIVLLRLSANRAQASRFAEDHNDWIRRGFDDGVFLLVGGVRPEGGGGILAHDTSLEQLRDRVAEDPFVAHGVVSAEILELAPWKADKRLEFLLD